ncbi:protein LAZ1 [Tanacetum coccineum]
MEREDPAVVTKVLATNFDEFISKDDGGHRPSFASVVNGTKEVRTTQKVNFRAMVNPDKVDNSDFVLPLAAVNAMKHKFENTLVGFFVGKMVAFTLHKNYVMNTWSKFGFEKVMSDDDGVTRIPVWVKFHKVPVVAYSEDGLSLLATQFGTPIMLDTFTSAMCVEAWGHVGYDRALIEVCADNELKQECPKRVLEKIMPDVEVHDDGFITVNKKKAKGKSGAPNQKGNFNGSSNGVKLQNLFEKLNEITSIVDPSDAKGKEETGGEFTSQNVSNGDDSDSEIEEVFTEENPNTFIQKGASTPYEEVTNKLKEEYYGFLNSAMREFKECVSDIEVMDVTSSGIHYTWNQNPRGGGGILKKLDRIMANMDFIDSFPGAYAIFQPYRILDHSPAILKLPSLIAAKPKPFKFFNFLAFKGKFMKLVEGHWNTNIKGHNMFKVVSKLKLMKKPLRKLLRDQGNLHDRVNLLRINLDTVQKALDSNPADLVLREEECVYLQAFNEAKLDEERFLKQKAKVEWLDVGNSNSVYFHKTLKIFSGADVECNELNVDGLFSKIVPMSIAANMVRNVTNEEIKSAMFDIGDEKAPGPDGFTSIFFKKGWSVVGDDICNAVHDFFSNGQILKEINHTFLALIPKVPTPIRVNDYRPISWIKEVVSENQSAFISGRRISDNILITQVLMYSYHKKKGPPRCAFKINIQKAYYTVDWRFLENILTRFGFHPTMVKWIMACVTSSSFSLSINGNIHGYFKGKRGLRQGDPLSPYLFTLVMEILTLILKKREFKLTSGLVPSLPKSTAYFCNVSNHTKNAILNIMPFYEGELPVKYLGVPFISSRLLNKDCKILVEKATNTIGDWKNKSLSFAGCFQLCKSVKLENGMSTSLWYDRWSDACPFINFLSPRDIHREGFHLKNVVANLIVNRTWAWPLTWLSKAPNLGLIVAPVLDMGQPDASQWRDRNGNLSLFSVAKAWEAIRARGNQDIGPNGDLNALRCALCESQPDSHPHLFFECRFSSKVWSYVRVLADMDLVPPNMHDIILYLQPLGNKRTVRSIFGISLWQRRHIFYGMNAIIELLRRLEDLRKRCEKSSW